MKKNNKKIIAVIGMSGAGKTEAVKYLLDKLKCPRIYFGEFTFERMKNEGLELNYKNERKTREKIREELGMGAYAILALPKIQQALKTSNTVILESLYSWEEYKIIKTKYKDSFKVLTIIASPDLRFARLTKRKKERPIKNRQEFDTRNYTEIEKTDKGGPIAMADFNIINEGTRKTFYQNLDLIIKKLK